MRTLDEVDQPPLAEVLEPARRGDEDVRALGALRLRAERDPAVRRRRRERPLATASGSSSSVTWAASSRVGTSTSAEGRASAGVVRSTIGSAKASVLPDPVATGEDVEPRERIGQDELLDAERMMDRASRRARRRRARTRRARGKTASTCSSTPLRVRDLPTSKHPKEEREAHLTGRRDCRSCSHSSSDTLGRCPRTSPNR